MRHMQSHIRYFVAVAEELHFRRASERLHVAQPVLSRAIRQLEDHLGVTLLQRSSRHVSLTAAGSVFLEECRRATEIMERAENRAIKADRGELGQLIIGYTDFAINGPLPKILAEFHRQCPEVRVDLIRRDSHEQLEDLERERIDLGFLTGPISQQGVEHYPVQQAFYVAVLPQDHPLAEQAAIHLSALAHEPFVLGNMDSWRHITPQIHACCMKAGFIPKVVREAPNSDSIFGLVAAKMGITIYPDCDLNYNRQNLAIRPLADIDFSLITEMVWLPHSHNRAVPRFIDIGITDT